jgi:hypothetical protein
MWSGFMDIDEARAKASKADDRLEKPFDAETLRNIVKNLVKKTGSQKLSEYLSFPDLPEFVEPATPIGVTPAAPVVSTPAASASTSATKSQAPLFPEIPETDEFVQVPLKTPSLPKNNEAWAHQDLNKFKIDLPEVELDEVTVNYVVPEGAIDESAFVTTDALLTPQEEQFSYGGPSAKKQRSEPQPQVPVEAAPAFSMDSSRIEDIVRSQAREIIESVVWKIIPDIAERVIREELEKILKESENKLRNP